VVRAAQAAAVLAVTAVLVVLAALELLILAAVAAVAVLMALVVAEQAALVVAALSLSVTQRRLLRQRLVPALRTLPLAATASIRLLVPAR
jgi:hypothetical protein